MDVNDSACCLNARGALRFFASKLAPTKVLLCANPVGASLLAMDVNDDVCCLNARGDLRFFASKLAPTGCGVRK